MRAAPPVQALSCTTGAWRLVQCVLYATATGSLVFWVACWWAGPQTLAVLAGSAAAAGAGALFMHFDCPLAQRLRWDGSTWCADAPGGDWVQGQPVLVIDLGSWLLVRLLVADHRPWQQSRWLPLSLADNRAAWHGLRTALHARAPMPEASPRPHARPPAG